LVVIAAEIEKEQLLFLAGRFLPDESQVIAIDLVDMSVAVDMQTLRRPPPLGAQLIVAILMSLANCKTHIVQFDDRIGAIATNVKHV